MPYKRAGKKIYHKKSGKWKVKQIMTSIANAKKAFRLLQGIKHMMKPMKRRKK